MRAGEGRWEADWPLVGRQEELAYVRDARLGKPPRAVVLGGSQGVGKSRLAAEALAQAQDEGWATERVDGAAATAAVPFGAVAHLAPADAASSGDPLRLLLSTAEHLTRRAARRPLMLVVDDAHDLDEASLALLRRLLSTPNLFTLVTIRSDTHVRAPIVGLWKDGDAHRLEVEPLRLEDTYRLVAEILGSEVDAGTLRWLWNHSLGNPLFLRELLLAERGDGWRRRADGVWTHARQHRPVGHRLTELVQTHLGELENEDRSVLEVLTIGGPLQLDLLSAMVPMASVASVVARGLAVAREGGHHPVRRWDTAAQDDVVVSLAHPLYGMVLSETLTAVRARMLRRQLLELLENTGNPTPGDAVRITTLRLDQGADVDAEQLVVASWFVRAAYPLTLAERLGAGTVKVEGLTAAVANAEPSIGPSQDDVALAERLARTAWETDRSLAAGLAWTAVLVAEGRAAEAELLIFELEGLADSDWDRTWVALARASLQFWVLDRADEASDILLTAETTIADPRAVHRLRRLRAGIALNIGRVDEAVDDSLELIASPDADEPVAAMAAATAAAGLSLAGRPADGVDLVDRFFPVVQAHVAEIPEVIGQLMLARLFGVRLLGRLDEAEWLGYACYDAAADNGELTAMGLFTGALGQIALDRGRPSTAARRLQEGEVLLRERDTFGYRPWVLACLSIALAQLGQADGAWETCGLARAAATRVRYFDPDLVLAEAWCHAAAGRLPQAVETAANAAELARGTGLHAFEAVALHTMARFGEPDTVGSRLSELAASAASPLWAAYAAHAQATADEDADGLADASATFEKLGAGLLAAEAAAAAAALYDRRDERAQSFRATSRSQALAKGCEGARTPALRLAVRAPWLSPREQEVAALAADGLTSKAIAERLVVSPRTVESHLYRIFAKLGVTDRSQLADLLGSANSVVRSFLR